MRLLIFRTCCIQKYLAHCFSHFPIVRKLSVLHMQHRPPFSLPSLVLASLAGYSTSSSSSVLVRCECTFLAIVTASLLTLVNSENLPGASGNAVLDIMAMRMGKPGALFLWVRLHSTRIVKPAPVSYLLFFSPLSVSQPFSLSKPRYRHALAPCTPSLVTTVSQIAATLDMCRAGRQPPFVQSG
jgi:hypothetical protein